MQTFRCVTQLKIVSSIGQATVIFVRLIQAQLPFALIIFFDKYAHDNYSERTKIAFKSVQNLSNRLYEDSNVVWRFTTKLNRVAAIYILNLIGIEVHSISRQVHFSFYDTIDTNQLCVTITCGLAMSSMSMRHPK